MKKLICFFASLPFLNITGAQDASVNLPGNHDTTVFRKNYVRVWDAMAPETNVNTIMWKDLNAVKQATQYFDGLGRPVQTVTKKGSMISGSAAVDLVMAQTYDEYGRELRKFLPFASSNYGSNPNINDGNFKFNPFAQQQNFYSDNNANSPVYGQSETYYYGKTEIESSPLSRPLRNYAPGNSWVHDDNGIVAKYYANTTTDSVRIWAVTNNSGAFGSYATSVRYNPGELYKTIMIDERDKQVVEFKDRRGRIILKKVQLTASEDTGPGQGHVGWLCTYYIYDDLDLLRCVIQPRGVELLNTVTSWSTTALSGDILNEQCFRYEYDAKGRMTMKKVPGAGEVYMIYDKRDRLVLTQDANMRNAGTVKWLYTKYDATNRPVATGLWNNSSSISYHAERADTSSIYPDLSGQTIEELTNTFYDSYAWRSSYSNPLSNTRDNTEDSYLLSTSTSFPFVQASAQANLLNNMVTGTRVKALGTSLYLYTVSFYDTSGKVIQEQSSNISGGTEILSTQYSWNGQPLMMIAKTTHNSSPLQTTIVLTKNTFDDLWRLTKTEKKIKSTRANSNNMQSEWTVISENGYDALGQLKKKKLGKIKNSDGTYNSNAIDSLKYDYNIRGWILGMNRSYVKDTTSTSNFFGFDLGYNKTTFTVNGTSLGYTAAQYNGNINGMLWRSTGDDMLRKYDYTYDGANRLTGADFNQLNSSSFSKAAGIDFSVSGLNYDGNGNILAMKQRGWKTTSSATIDTLTYSYVSNSNKLLKVIDGINTDNKLGDFYDGTNGSNNDYSYDANGNMTVDNNKAISLIRYNHLNLPDSIVVTSKGNIKYIYDAAGTKLKKITTEGSTAITTLYQGEVVYRNDTLEFVGMEEGRIRFNFLDATMNYDYFVKDHLGNVRLVLTEEKDTSIYPMVKFEDGTYSNESIYYENVNVERTPRPGNFYDTTNNGQKVQLLRKSTQAIGTGKLLKVMAKDRLHVRVDYYIQNDATDNSNANGVSSVISALTSLINTSSVTETFHGEGNAITGNLNNSFPFTNFLAPQGAGQSSSNPKAYLNILFFDEQFRFVSQNSEIVQVTTKGSGQTILKISGDAKDAAKNGYVYVFVNNESNNLVYFDNMQITHERGPIIEETHYYPFGLTMAGISSKALNFGRPTNKENTFQGQRFDDELGLNWIQFKWRNHDPQIGRFIEIDPLAEKYVYNSTYAFSENKVTGHVELEGLEAAKPETDPEKTKQQRDQLNEARIEVQKANGPPKSNVSLTFAITHGEDFSVGFSGTVAPGVKIGAASYTKEKDVIGIRDNKPVVGGTETETKDDVRRSGDAFGIELGPIAASFSDVTETRSFNNTILSEQTTESFQLGLKSTTVVTEKTRDKETRKTETNGAVEVFGFKWAAGLGVEASVKIYAGPNVASGRMPGNHRDATSVKPAMILKPCNKKTP